MAEKSADQEWDDVLRRMLKTEEARALGKQKRKEVTVQDKNKPATVERQK